MKETGLLLVASSFLAAGVCAVREREKRLRFLRAFCIALDQIASELSLRDTPLPALFANAAERSPREAAGFFTELASSLENLGAFDFGELWKRGIDRCGLPLRNSERVELIALGEILGRYETKVQVESILAYRENLGQALRAEETAFPGERRMLLGLCAGMGVLLLILLI